MAACSPAFGQVPFIAEIMRQVDCQVQTVGVSGFGALANPSSTTLLIASGLLTLFIAAFGIRLLLGDRASGRDVVLDILKIGIVLTLATSWPAWRILGFNVVVHAPTEIAETIGGAAGLPGANRDLSTRLARADEAIVGLTIFGSGRLTGGQSAGGDLSNSFQGAALSDQSALGWGRLAFLAGVLAPLVGVKVAAGILVALAPLMAGLLLFAQTSALFVGWLRGLTGCAVSTLGLSLLYGIELAVLEPWLSNVLAQRQGNFLAPSAPTELLVITLSFAIGALLLLIVFLKVAFFPERMGFASFVVRDGQSPKPAGVLPEARPHRQSIGGAPSRAFAVSNAVQETIRRETAAAYTSRASAVTSSTSLSVTGGTERGVALRAPALGDTYRRSYRRASNAAGRRDRMK